MSDRPYSRFRFTPDVSFGRTLLSCRPAFAFEVERGAQAGVRLGVGAYQRDDDNSQTVALDQDGAVVPAQGETYAWLKWDADVDASRALELVVWHAPATYTRQQAGHFRAARRVRTIVNVKSDTPASDTTYFPGPSSVETYDNLREIDAERLQSLADGHELYGFVSGYGSTSWLFQLWQADENGTLHLSFERAATASAADPARRYVDVNGVWLPSHAWQARVVNLDGANGLEGAAFLNALA